MTPEEQNKVIAEFMGYRYYAGGFSHKDGGRGNWFKEAKYDRSWDWLMPVIEKASVYAHVRIQINICAITRKFISMREYAKANNIPDDKVPPIAEHNDKGFIGNVHAAVYDFIVWYNSLTDKKENP